MGAFVKSYGSSPGCKHGYILVVQEEMGKLSLHCMACSANIPCPMSWMYHPGFHMILDFTTIAHNSIPRKPHEFAR